jgi:hypothetical protein
VTRAKVALFDVASDEDAREMRANITEFFSILLEWDGAIASSASPTEVESQSVVKARGRKPKP